MSTRGRKPKPTSLKVLQGTDRADRINPDEPTPLDRIPDCPEHLPTLAKVEWGRTSEKLHRLGLLTEIDGTALELYCVAYGRWVEALEHIQTEEPVLKSENGGTYQNPWLSVANKAFDQMAKMLAEFGMTPSARTRVKATKVEHGKDPAKKFFRSG